jgi:hypothetical protein
MRRNRSHQALCIAVASLTIIVAMTACAGDPPDRSEGADDTAGAAPGPTTLTQALSATRAVDSARVELRTTVGNAGTPLTVVYRAAFTDAGLRAEASADMSEVAATLEAAGQQVDGDWSQPTGVVLDGDVVYAQLGPLAAALGRDPSDWVRNRLGDLAATGADNDAFALVLDPLGPLDLLRLPVVEIGEATGDDDATARDPAAPTEPAPVGRHLRALLDLRGSAPADAVADAAAEGTAGDGAAVHDAAGGGGTGPPLPGSFEERLVAAGIDTLPVDVWVDDSGVVRRLVVSVEGADTLTTTFDVYDVGADITIATPDASEVVLPPPGANGAGEP